LDVNSDSSDGSDDDVTFTTTPSTIPAVLNVIPKIYNNNQLKERNVQVFGEVDLGQLKKAEIRKVYYLNSHPDEILEITRGGSEENTELQYAIQKNNVFQLSQIETFDNGAIQIYIKRYVNLEEKLTYYNKKDAGGDLLAPVRIASGKTIQDYTITEPLVVHDLNCYVYLLNNEMGDYVVLNKQKVGGQIVNMYPYMTTGEGIVSTDADNYNPLRIIQLQGTLTNTGSLLITSNAAENLMIDDRIINGVTSFGNDLNFEFDLFKINANFVYSDSVLTDALLNATFQVNVAELTDKWSPTDLLAATFVGIQINGDISKSDKNDGFNTITQNLTDTFAMLTFITNPQFRLPDNKSIGVFEPSYKKNIITVRGKFTNRHKLDTKLPSTITYTLSSSS